MAFCEKDKVWWEAAPAAHFHSGSSSDQKRSGAADKGDEATKLAAWAVRRRCAKTVAEAHDLAGLNSIARARVLISGALAAAKLLEPRELAERIHALEAAVLRLPNSGDDSLALS